MEYETFSSSVELVTGLIFAILYYIGAWKVFVKAGKPGWAALVPIYNLYVLLKVINRPIWWMIFYIIPLANIITMLVVGVALAKTFSKGQIFGVFLLGFFPMIGYPILGFGKSTYTAPLLPAPPAPPSQPS